MNVYGITYPPELLTNLEVARILSTSLRGVADLVSRGELTRVDDGGKRVKFRLTDVRAYVARLPPASDTDPGTYPAELLTRDDVAYLLSMSSRHVADIIRSRALPSIDVSTRGRPMIRVRLSDVRAYIDALPENHD